MAWLWINPQSEPAQMVNDVLAVTNTEFDEVAAGLSDAESGCVIADLYNKAEEIGVTPVQERPNSNPFFGR
jgi:hypothetical protein